MPLYEFKLSTDREGMYDITDRVRSAIDKAGVSEGLCIVHCPHTTAGITINENADPDVQYDFLKGMARAFPDDPSFRHSEGNSAAHLKSSCVGPSQTVIIDDRRPVLGTWQGIYFCEFDGPRHRRFLVSVQ